MTILPTSQADLTQAELDIPPHEHTGKPIKSYDRFLSREAKARGPSPLKALAVKYLGQEGQISFGGGLPHPSTFPVSQLAFTFPYLGKTVVMSSPEQPADEDLTTVNGSANAALYTPLSLAMQYSGSIGSPKLSAFLREHVQRTHNVPYDDWEVLITHGATDGMDSILRALCERGDNLLIEEFCYPGTLNAAVPQGIKPIPVRLDSQGMVPEHMEEILSTWSTAEQGPKPRCMVAVTTGSNPNGSSMPLERRKAIYAIAQRHDLLIIADEPYRALVLNYAEDGLAAPPASSFLQIDTDARVIDSSSFSKTVAPGSRIGWITAPSQIIERCAYRAEVTTQSISGFSLAAITSFLGAIGGQEGWEKYLRDMSLAYSARARRMDRLFTEYLPQEVVSWNRPQAGMFFSVYLKAAQHPLYASQGADAVLAHVFETGIAHGVTTAPSDLFKADPATPSNADNVFLRCSFSYTSEDEMAEGARRLGVALRESFGI